MIIWMDEVTQQSAVLVEEAAASAEAMQEQALALTAAVHIFKLNKAKVNTQAAVAKPPPRLRQLSNISPGHPLGKERKLINAKIVTGES